ncbi:MAG: TetR family transcriptional regulator [Deltaproteobacteria bacterium]|nr:TetR family transcriptional regulator [Deltaproteobacteria bacterium]
MRKDGSKTREQIIEESLQLFSVKGYFNTSINDILEATGLTKGGLYGHFSSKEELWGAAYERAVEIWKGIVFKGARKIADPLARIEKVVENDLFGYCGAEVFDGGCFFFNMLVELSGQSETMSRRIRAGFVEFARLLASWLTEAERKGLLKKGVKSREVADFIVIAINGATALYTASRDRRLLKETSDQLRAYLRQMRA